LGKGNKESKRGGELGESKSFINIIYDSIIWKLMFLKKEKTEMEVEISSLTLVEIFESLFE